MVAETLNEVCFFMDICAQVTKENESYKEMKRVKRSKSWCR